MRSRLVGRVLNAALGAAFVFVASATAPAGAQMPPGQAVPEDVRQKAAIAIGDICLASGGSVLRLVRLVAARVPAVGGVHVDEHQKGIGSFWFGGSENLSGFGLNFTARAERADEIEHCQATLFTREATALVDGVFETLSPRNVEPVVDPFEGKQAVGRTGLLARDGVTWRLGARWTRATNGNPDMVMFTASPER